MSTEAQVFDPREKTDEEGGGEAVVWTSQAIEWALESIKMGKPLKRNVKSPFFDNNPQLRRGELVFQYTDWELQEIAKCKKNIMYWIENYAKIKRPDGKIGHFKLRNYQLRQVKDYLTFDEIILGWSRQSGKTIGTSLYILWCMLFNVDKSTALLANKGDTSKEVLDKIKSIYVNLPFFMQPGILGWNTGVVSFDNGCQIYRGPTTPDALNGKTCNILYIDEFAYIGKGKNKIEYQQDFLANAMPVLSSQKNSGLCKLIISSTPLGKEYFYELFNKAYRGEIKMKASKVCWWEIPDKTLDWAKDQIGKIGITKFKQQFEMSFDTHAETLLHAKTMRHLMRNKISYPSGEFDILSNYEEYLYMHPEVEIDPDFDVFCLSVDIAEGLNQDYSTIQIMRLGYDEDNEKHIHEQIGLFACNTIPIEDFAVVVRELFNTLNPEYSKLLVEANTYGDHFFKCLNSLGLQGEDIAVESICKFKRTKESKKKSLGLRTNKEVKKIAVKSFKTLVDNKNIRILESSTIAEIENFQENEKGTFQAVIGHDDKVTPLINFSYWVQLAENEYTFWLEDFNELNDIAVDTYMEDEEDWDEELEFDDEFYE
jgi:hypothetical protein